jgi:hypothetical protein
VTALVAARGRGLLIEQVRDALVQIPPRVAVAHALVEHADPRAGRAVGAVARSALEALDGLRGLLPLVGGGADAPYAPVPGLAEVRLEAARRAQDPRISFTLDRTFGRVPAGVQLVLHHALTTCLAVHDAGTGAAAVRLHRRRDAIELVVAFDGVPGPAAEAVAAMAARAALYAGRVDWADRCALLLWIPLTSPREPGR